MVRLVVLAIIFYVLFGVCASRVGGRIDATLSAVIFNGVATFIPLVVVFWQLLSKGRMEIVTTPLGVFWSVLAGVAIAAFSVLLVEIFSVGGNLSYVFPMLYGSTIVLASLIGWSLFNEYISTLQLCGIVVIIIGIGLVAWARI